MYRCERWESAKRKLQHYRRREPERSVLYGLVFHGRERLPLVWEERFQGTYGVLRNEVLKTFDEYLNCGILEHGAARVYCDTCRYSFLVAFSCKKRGICPSCAAKRAVKFAEHLYEEVLEPVPNRHIIFTTPKRVRPFFKYDRSLNDILFQAAWGSIREVLGSDIGVPAAVLTVQTAGEALNHNPHLHGCLANGLFTPEGTFMPFGNIDQEKLTKRFGERVLAPLHKQELISDEVVAQILSQEHSGFSVWLGEPFHDTESSRFVARYIERGPISLQKLELQDDIVSYTTNDGVVHEFDALEFLALLSAQVPLRHESLTRYFGWYSCRSRGERKKRAAIHKPEQSQEPRSPPSPTWRECIKRIYEIDPLECPKCKGTMRIIAFLQDNKEIKKIMKSLSLPDFRTPPPIPKSTSPPESFFPNDEFP